MLQLFLELQLLRSQLLKLIDNVVFCQVDSDYRDVQRNLKQFDIFEFVHFDVFLAASHVDRSIVVSDVVVGESAEGGMPPRIHANPHDQHDIHFVFDFISHAVPNLAYFLQHHLMDLEDFDFILVDFELLHLSREFWCCSVNYAAKDAIHVATIRPIQ